MDREAWRVAVHGVQSRTRLSDWSDLKKVKLEFPKRKGRNQEEKIKETIKKMKSFKLYLWSSRNMTKTTRSIRIKLRVNDKENISKEARGEKHITCRKK